MHINATRDIPPTAMLIYDSKPVDVMGGWFSLVSIIMLFWHCTLISSIFVYGNQVAGNGFIPLALNPYLLQLLYIFFLQKN